MKFDFRRYFFLATIFLFSNVLYSQGKQLRVGDKVPQIELSPVINYFVKNVKISDFKEKLLILDFWATWCHPCIAAFPKIDTLQKYFGNKIQILPVTYESSKVVSDFLSRIHKGKNLITPSVTDGEYLKEYFPHTILPHCVWIYDGIVMAITEGSEITRENIQKLLKEKELHVRTKEDGKKLVDRSKSFFNIGYNAKYINNDSSVVIPFDTSKVKFYSIITNDYTENENGFGYPMGFDSNGITIGNVIIKKLFLWAFSEMKGEFVFENRISVEINDSAKHDPAERKGLEAIDWMNEGHSYSYELKVPPELFDKRFKIMQNDLNNYFGNVLGIVGGIEKRKRPCLVLTKVNESNVFYTKGGVPEIKDSRFHLAITNMNLSWLIEKLRLHRFNNTKAGYYSVVNEVGDNIKSDIKIEGDLSDLNEVNKELAKYGLRFIKEEREIEVVVIKDK